VSSIVEGFRTRLRPGAAEEYRRVHAAIPGPLAHALAGCGLLSWRIWIDGETLFHAIETRDGRDAMVERMSKLPPVDPAWDALIDTLVDPSPESASALDAVWEFVAG
jgi:L-rhamnose mutarotase